QSVYRAPNGARRFAAGAEAASCGTRRRRGGRCQRSSHTLFGAPSFALGCDRCPLAAFGEGAWACSPARAGLAALGVGFGFDRAGGGAGASAVACRAT